MCIIVLSLVDLVHFFLSADVALPSFTKLRSVKIMQLSWPQGLREWISGIMKEMEQFNEEDELRLKWDEW